MKPGQWICACKTVNAPGTSRCEHCGARRNSAELWAFAILAVIVAWIVFVALTR